MWHPVPWSMTWWCLVTGWTPWSHRAFPNKLILWLLPPSTQCMWGGIWNMGGLESPSSRATCQKTGLQRWWRAWSTWFEREGWGNRTCLGCKNKMKACFKYSQALFQEWVTKITEINHSFWQQVKARPPIGAWEVQFRLQEIFRRKGAATLKLVSWKNATVTSMEVFGLSQEKSHWSM